MLPFYKKHEGDVFMHDGAPCHRARVVFEYLKSVSVPILDWPGNSTDLNLIKNCWDNLKNYSAIQLTISATALKEGIVKL